jgi:hypothetical protein
VLLRENLHPSIRFRNREWESGKQGWRVSCVLMVQLPDNQFWASERPGGSALRQLDYSQLAARIGDPVARLRGTSWLSTPARFLAPSRSGDGGSGISHSSLWPKIKLGGKFRFARVCIKAHARQTARISFFLDPLSLFKKNDPLQGKGLGASILLIRSLRPGSQSATTK